MLASVARLAAMSPVASARVAAPSLRSATFALVAVGDDASAMAARLCAAANLASRTAAARSAATTLARSVEASAASARADRSSDSARRSFSSTEGALSAARRSAAVNRGRRRDGSDADAATFCFVDDFVDDFVARATRFAADVRVGARNRSSFSDGS